jgi:hypothetical protein
MAIFLRLARDVVGVVAVVVGVPVIVAFFLGVLGFCYLEWLHDTLVSRLSMPTKHMRTMTANP